MTMADSVTLPGIPGYNPDNLQPWTVAVVASMTVLSTVTVVLRMASRYIKAQGLWWDDYTILFSQAWNYIVVGFIFAMYAAGMGIHANKIAMDDIVLMAKFLVVAEILYACNLCWTKISILLMYYRIFHFPYFKKMAYGIGGFVIAWLITVIFLFIFICVPVEKLWYPDLPGHCIDQVGTWIANAASTILSDVAILLLPIPQVWKLQLRRPEKIGVTFAFCLGFFVVFASAYRFTVLFSYSNSDPTYTLAPTVGWTAIEMSAGIVSANLPTIGPVMGAFFRKLGIKRSLLGSSLNRTGGGGGGGSTMGGTNNALSSSARNFNAPPKSASGSLSDDRTDVELEMQVPVPVPKSSSTTAAPTGMRKGSGKGAFYRLPDEHTAGETVTAPADMGLRPDHGCAYTVTSHGQARGGNVKGDGESWSGDEVPLRGIRVHTDFKQSAS